MLFVGCDSYTAHYERSHFSNTNYWTIEPDPAHNKVRAHTVLTNGGYEACFRCVAAGHAIEIGIPWVESHAENRDGVLEQACGRNLGGHALAIVGYTRRVDREGRKYLLMANSHGPEWGNNGWAEVAPCLFDQWARDGFSELIGISDLQTFGPAGGDRVNWLKGGVF